MKEIKDLQVTVTYKVGLQGLEIDSDTLDELIDIWEEGRPIEPAGLNNKGYKYAPEWLGNLIQERDSHIWEIEIDDLDFEE